MCPQTGSVALFSFSLSLSLSLSFCGWVGGWVGGWVRGWTGGRGRAGGWVSAWGLVVEFVGLRSGGGHLRQLSTSMRCRPQTRREAICGLHAFGPNRNRIRNVGTSNLGVLRNLPHGFDYSFGKHVVVAARKCSFMTQRAQSLRCPKDSKHPRVGHLSAYLRPSG